MKLTLQHLAPYLPYGLKCKLDTGEIEQLLGLEQEFESPDWGAMFKEFGTWPLDRIKPILHPLSDLTKEITVNRETFKPRDIILSQLNHVLTSSIIDNINESVIHLDYTIVQKLFEWKFDVFGLIELGLAIDVNTLEVNPY